MTDSPYVFEIDEHNYEQIVIDGSHEVPVLVDFWASWCQPCQVLMPVLASLVEEFQGRFVLAKIDTEEQQAIAQQFGIRSIPTVKLFKNGQPVDEFAGALPEAEIRSFLEKHLPRPSDTQVEQALRMLLDGDAGGALEILRMLQAQDPSNPRISVVMAQAHAARGEPEAARDILDAMPASEQDSPDVQSLRSHLYFDLLLQGKPDRATLAARLEADPADSEAQFLLAAHKVADQDVESAMQMLVALVRKDRQYGDDAARNTLLKLFDMLGDSPLVPVYRRQLFNLLH